MKAVAVERWLRSLPYAPSTKAKLRNQLSSLFSHAIRHELWEKLNPISAVRQSSKRLGTPDILSMDEMRLILDGLSSELHRTAILVAAVMGLRRSEVRGLKWSDLDFDNLWCHLRQGKIKKFQTKLKTVASRRGVPMTQDLADALHAWRRSTLYPEDSD